MLGRSLIVKHVFGKFDYFTMVEENVEIWPAQMLLITSNCLIITMVDRRGWSGKYLRNICRKFVLGIILYPPANFFQNRRFFHQFFWDPPNFFRKCNFFLLKIWDPPIFLSDNAIVSTEKLGSTYIPTLKNRHSIVTECRRLQIAVSTIQYQLGIKMNWLLDFIKKKITAVKSSVY